MPYVHERDLRGNIVLTHHVPASFSETTVPVLGDYLDDLMDSARMPDAFISAVYSSYVAARSRDDFARAIAHMCTWREALFLWRWIDVPSAGAATTRYRDNSGAI